MQLGGLCRLAAAAVNPWNFDMSVGDVALSIRSVAAVLEVVTRLETTLRGIYRATKALASKLTAPNVVSVSFSSVITVEACGSIHHSDHHGTKHGCMDSGSGTKSETRGSLASDYKLPASNTQDGLIVGVVTEAETFLFNETTLINIQTGEKDNFLLLIKNSAGFLVGRIAVFDPACTFVRWIEDEMYSFQNPGTHQISKNLYLSRRRYGRMPRVQYSGEIQKPCEAFPKEAQLHDVVNGAHFSCNIHNRQTLIKLSTSGMTSANHSLNQSLGASPPS